MKKNGFNIMFFVFIIILIMILSFRSISVREKQKNVDNRFVPDTGTQGLPENSDTGGLEF
jgi:hypothetical protein